MDRMDEIEGKGMEIVKNSLAWMKMDFLLTLLILSKYEFGQLSKILKIG